MTKTLELPPAAGFEPPEPPEQAQQEASRHRHRRTVALSAAAALVAGGAGTPFLVLHGGGSDKKISAPAPARPSPSSAAAKTTPPHTTPAARPSAHHPAPSLSSSPRPPIYDKTAVVECLGLRATQPAPGTLEVTPILKKVGHPDPDKFVTVVDRTHTSATSAPIQETQVAKGFGTPIEVTHVNTDVSAQVGRDLVAVSVYYYPHAMPTDPADFSFLKPTGPGTNRTGDGCGEGVQTLHAPGGVLMNPPGA